MKMIKSILVDGQGYKYASDGKIVGFEVAGEMSNVAWYRQGNSEWNGKYVVEINYYKEKQND